MFNDHNKKEYPPMHTAEHIINRAMDNHYHCGRSIEAHIERKKSKLDYHLPQSPTQEEIDQIQDTVNEVISRHLPVEMEYITQQEAIGRFDLRRLPDDASQNLRVVHIGTYDECLCIGDHVDNTSQIGKVKINSWTWQDKRLRIRFKLVDE